MSPTTASPGAGRGHGAHGSVLVVNSGSSSHQVPAGRPGRRRGDRVGHRRADRRGRGLGPAHVRRQHDRAHATRSPTTAQALRAVLAPVRRGRPGPRRRRTWSRSATGWCTAAAVFGAPVLVDDEVVAPDRRPLPLAPLHNPPNLTGIQVARELLPDVPHVVVFDTAFFRTLPEAAATYAIDREVAARARRAPVRVPRDVAPVRVRQGRARARPPARGPQPDRAAPGQRRVGVGGPRRRRRRDVDGHDPARGSGHGHPVGRHRPGRRHPPAAQRRAVDRRGRRPAQPALRPQGAGGRERLPRAARAGRRRRRGRARWRSTSTCTGCASTSARTTRCSAGSTSSRSPRASARTTPSSAPARSRAWSRWASRSTRTATPAARRSRRSSPRTGRSTLVMVVPTNEELAIARQAIATIEAAATRARATSRPGPGGHGHA